MSVNLPSMARRAYLAAADGRYREALAHYRALEVADPKTGDWPTRQAEILFRMGQKDESIAALERAMVAYREAQDAARTAEVASSLLKLAPDHREAARHAHRRARQPPLALGSRNDIPEAGTVPWTKLHTMSKQERMSLILDRLVAPRDDK